MICPLSIRSVEVCSQAIIKRIIRLLLFLGKRPCTWGVGFDATLLDKVTVAFDYYDRKTTGIIMDVPVPPEFGLGAYQGQCGLYGEPWYGIDRKL